MSDLVPVPHLPAEDHSPTPRGEFSEAYTIIHVVPRDGVAYWMLLDYGHGAEHQLDFHYHDPDPYGFGAFTIQDPSRLDGFTHTARSGHDGTYVQAVSLDVLLEYMARQRR